MKANKLVVLAILMYTLCVSLPFIVLTLSPISVGINEVRSFAVAGKISPELYYLAKHKYLTENISRFHIKNGILYYPLLLNPVRGKYFLNQGNSIYMVVVTVIKGDTLAIFKVPINSSSREFQHYCRNITCSSFSSSNVSTIYIVKPNDLTLLQTLSKEIKSFSLRYNLSQNETINLINNVVKLSVRYYGDRWKNNNRSVTITVINEKGQTKKVTLHAGDEATLAVTRGGVCYDRAWFKAYLMYHVLGIPTDIALTSNNSHAIVATEKPVYFYTTSVKINNETYYLQEEYAFHMSGFIKILWNSS